MTLPEPILFVFGAARGGTTFVNGLLAKHFGFSMGPEGTFIQKIHRQRRRYRDLSRDADLDRLLQDICRSEMLEIMRSRWPAPHRIDITPDILRRHLPERTLAGAVFATLSAIRELRGRRHLGIKDPAFWMHLDVLETLFSTQARYLFVIRDGRDVALSNFHVEWGQRSAYACARQWVRMVKAVKIFSSKIDPHRLMLLRYEDILGDPAKAMEHLQNYLGVQLDKRTIDGVLDELNTSPKASNFGKWKSQMSTRDVRIYEAIAAKQLAIFGYEIVNPDSRLFPAESLGYETLEILRKARMTLKRTTRNRAPLSSSGREKQ